MISLYFRSTLNPPKIDQSAVIGIPLTIEQIDSNFKSIQDGFVDVNDQLTIIDKRLDKCASMTNPEFKGSIVLPENDEFAMNSKNGTVIFDVKSHSPKIFINGKWANIVTDADSGYVKKTGDVMSGKLVGLDASFFNHIRTLPTDWEYKIGIEETDLDKVATSGWVSREITKQIARRLGGEDPDGADAIVPSQSDINIKYGNLILQNGTFFGDADFGELD